MLERDDLRERGPLARGCLLTPQLPSYTPTTAAGNYTFAASYPQDSVNTNAAPDVTCDRAR
jgi:hypothetical protein